MFFLGLLLPFLFGHLAESLLDRGQRLQALFFGNVPCRLAVKVEALTSVGNGLQVFRGCGVAFQGYTQGAIVYLRQACLDGFVNADCQGPAVTEDSKFFGQSFQDGIGGLSGVC